MSNVLANIRHRRIIISIHTVAETDIFASDAKAIWSDEGREAFINWIAANPLAGEAIPGSGGCRKVRWARSGMGKRGGARVIYYNRLGKGQMS